MNRCSSGDGRTVPLRSARRKPSAAPNKPGGRNSHTQSYIRLCRALSIDATPAPPVLLFPILAPSSPPAQKHNMNSQDSLSNSCKNFDSYTPLRLANPNNIGVTNIPCIKTGRDDKHMVISTELSVQKLESERKGGHHSERCKRPMLEEVCSSASRPGRDLNTYVVNCDAAPGIAIYQ